MNKHVVLPGITVALGLAALPGTGLAQATQSAAPQLSEIEVIAQRVISRNRVDTPSPTLSYDEAYFQRFEPLSVGDMMKRVPGVVFSSDVGEYSAPSLRGVGTQYTQVLINGRRVTGATNDNTVTLDRIPAELVERVEIIRSPSSDIDSQGIGGTINIILKEGAELSGGIYRIGAYYIDEETKPSGFLSFGDSNDRLDWSTSLNYQERFNRKLETDLERFFDGEGNPEPQFSAVTEGPDERESTDIAWTGDLRLKLGEERTWSIGAFYIDTDRDELELGREFEAEDDDGELETGSEQANQSDAFNETNYGIYTGIEAGFGNGHSWSIELAYDNTDYDSLETNWVDDLDFDFATIGIDDVDDIPTFLEQTNGEIMSIFAAVPHDADQLREDEFLDSQEDTNANDNELRFKSAVDIQLSGSKLKVGIELKNRDRDFSFLAYEMDDGVLEPDDSTLSLFDATEKRYDGFVKWSIDFSDDKTLELGLRGEDTNLDIDATVSDAIADAADELAAIGINIDGNQIDASNDNFELNPSAHFRWDVTDQTVMRFSVARTVRRPSFDQLNPTLIIDDEESILGNPGLQQETAIGVDAGFDVSLGGSDSILGFNLFYRQIDDKIELNGVPDEVNQIFQDFIDEDIEATVWINNPNEGEVWGAELDLSYPLGFIENFQVFANYTYIDSEIQDANSNYPIKHAFSEQPDYVFNAGFDHLIKNIGLTWGLSYQERGDSQRWTDESAETKLVRDISFDGNLEAFIEKTLSERFVIRLAAQNLLDAKKVEVERAYESVDQLQNGTPVTERTLIEEADPSFILTFRGTF